MLATTEPYGILDIANPVECQHPLNRGLKSWWISLPGRSRGTTLRDIAGANHATLVNGVKHATPKGRIGGYGSLEYIGSGSRLDVTDSTELTALFSGNFTVTLWVNKAANDQYYRLFSKGKDSATVSRVDMLLGGIAANHNNVTFDFYQGGVLRTLYSPLDSFNVPNVWRRISFRYDQVNMSIAIDGVATSQAQTGVVDTTTGTTLRIGTYLDGSTHPVVGFIDSIKIYNRAIPDDELRKSIYEEKQGSPNTLRWISTRYYSVPAVVAGVFVKQVGQPYRLAGSGGLAS
jgi:hypothetical protein